MQTLEKLGFVQIRQRGSHLILKKQFISKEGKINQVGCVIPMQRKTLAVGTLKNILNQAGVSLEEFLQNLQ
ncbi:hypothetical protein AsFPU1_2208 [Aphanothece sacrum FPU1]|uniref:YcfA family protein n=1 Tax=Aphanothece sacrum FPU1 TaxID=1920663 RepID=A0A401IHN9_APHSA|nr:hypothetical protein AsFPU1_2208 [Aphanothece sacrum FPU1]